MFYQLHLKQLFTMKNILYLLLIIFLSISQNLFSISKEINKIGLKEGLPDNYILTTEQDGDGFVWIGTEIGLCRFDGYKFINFTTESKNAKEHLLDNAINKILYDSIYNTIWIATKKGVPHI